MNRRSFLKFLGGAAATAVVAPSVSYFFAPRGGWQRSPGEALYHLDRAGWKFLNRAEWKLVNYPIVLEAEFPALPEDAFRYVQMLTEMAEQISGVPPQYHNQRVIPGGRSDYKSLA